MVTKRIKLKILILIFFFVFISALLLTLRRGDVHTPVLRIKEYHIKGENQFYVRPFEKSIIVKKESSSDVIINHENYFNEAKRNFYTIKGSEAYAIIPFTGEECFISFYAKSKKQKHMVMRVEVDGRVVLSEDINTEIQEYSITLSQIEKDPDRNIRVEIYFNSVAGLTDRDLQQIETLISDFQVQIKNPNLNIKRYNYQKWVSDRILLLQGTSLMFDVQPQDKSFLFFTACIYEANKILPENFPQGSFYVYANKKGGDRHKLLEYCSLQYEMPMEMMLIPLEKDYKEIEIYYKNGHPDVNLAIGNLMILNKIEVDQKRDIFTICIDTLRRNHLGVYGYDRNTSPNINRFAEDAVLFSNAISNSSWTMPSAFSLFLGQHAFMHDFHWGYNILLPADLKSAVQTFQSNGYFTIGLIANPLISDKHGFSKGFDLYYEYPGHIWMCGSEISNEAIKLINILKDFNIFMYLWYFDPHDPYIPPDLYSGDYIFQGTPSDYVDINVFHEELVEYGYRDPELRSKISTLIDQYDSCIQFVDKCIGLFFNHLKELGLYDNSLIVLYSDHGEEFLEHGNVKHGYSIYEEKINIPLILKFPDNQHRGTTLRHTVDLTDVFPTIWDITGLPRLHSFVLGQNLLVPDYDRLLVSVTDSNSPIKIILKKNNIKYIRFYNEYNHLYKQFFNEGDFHDLLNQYIYEIHPAVQLFDLNKDPQEQDNVYDLPEYRVYVEYFEDVLKKIEPDLLSCYKAEEFQTGRDDKRSAEEKNDMFEALRALGYIN